MKRLEAKPKIKATFFVKTATRSDTEIIFNALKAELMDEIDATRRVERADRRVDGSADGRAVERVDRGYSISLDLRNEDLILSVFSEDLVKLRAVLNSWLRMIKVASEMIDLQREHGSVALVSKNEKNACEK